MAYQYVDAMTLIEKLHGVGPSTASVFREAGMRTVGEVKAQGHQHHLLQQAIDRLKEREEKPARWWRRQASTCESVVIRLQSPNAEGHVPAAFMCPISMTWYQVSYEIPLSLS